MNEEYKEIELETTQLTKHNRKMVLTIAISVFLAVVLATGITLAVLTDLFTDTSTPTIGSIEAGLYTDSGATLISGTYDGTNGYIIGSPIIITLPGSMSPGTATLDLSIKNTGTIDAIARIFISIHYDGLVAGTSQLAFNNAGWVNSFESAGTWFLYSYYNSVATPNTVIPIGTTIQVLDEDLLNKNVEIMVRVDMVAYSGNAYQIEADGATVADADKPFGVLDSGFLSGWTAWQ